MKSEILNVMNNIIGALNNVQIMPGKDNWLNQGGSIAMLEDLMHQIDSQLVDKPSDEDKETGN